MNTITIPRGFVVIPRAEYESLKARIIPEYTPTATERRAIMRARARMHKNRVAGKMVSLDVLEQDLANRG